MCFKIESVTSVNEPCQDEASIQLSTHDCKEMHSQSKISLQTNKAVPVSLVCFWNSVVKTNVKWTPGLNGCIVYE